MNDRAPFVGVCFLGILAVLSLGGIVAASTMGREVPPSLAAAFGVAVGALSGIISPTNRNERQ